ncbi:MAG: hypothetical protein GY757_01200 [bacterium]|nr:hypothetical protein [bacterium]
MGKINEDMLVGAKAIAGYLNCSWDTVYQNYFLKLDCPIRQTKKNYTWIASKRKLDEWWYEINEKGASVGSDPNPGKKVPKRARARK